MSVSPPSKENRFAPRNLRWMNCSKTSASVSFEHPQLLVSIEFDLVQRRLDPILDPLFNPQIVNMHELKAQSPAIRRLQSLRNLSQTEDWRTC